MSIIVDKKRILKNMQSFENRNRELVAKGIYLEIKEINKKLNQSLFVINRKLDDVLLLRGTLSNRTNTTSLTDSAVSNFPKTQEVASYLGITKAQLEELTDWGMLQCCVSEDGEMIYSLDELDKFAIDILEPMKQTFKF
jgi:hypothetical protein